MSYTKREKIYLVVIVVLLLSNLLLIYLDYRDDQKNQSIIASKNTELQQTYYDLDSLGYVLDEKINIIDSLGGDIDTLLALKEQLQREKEYIRSSSRKEISALRNRVEGYKELLLMKDEEIETLKRTNEALFEENTALKTEKNELFDSINELSRKEKELTSKVALASRLEAENVKVYVVNDRGKEREGEFRDRHISAIRVDFEIAENEIAPVGGRQLYLRILDQNGEPVFDTELGSGTFVINNQEFFYSSNKEILYDKSRQEISMSYAKDSEYTPGTYTVILYAEDYKIGETTFTVK